VHVDQKSLVSFQSQAEPGSWIRTMANGVTNGSGNAGQTGNGGPNTKYMVISLNPHIFRSIHNHGYAHVHVCVACVYVLLRME
jgi:hypothetical protein